MKWFRILGFLVAVVVCPKVPAQTATITWTTTHQTIDGFGVSDAFQGSAMTSANADTLFSTSTGAGLSLLRTGVPSNCSDSTGNCSTVNSGCAGNNKGDMALAVARGAKIWSTAFTPPALMKTNASCTNGGSLLSGSYEPYATWLTNYVTSVQTYAGITPYAVSVTNEPDQHVSYDSAVWTAQNIHDFVLNDLGPSFSAAGLTTKIMLPEASCANLLASYANTTMEDPAAAAYVGIVADHDYCNKQVSYATGGKPEWQTELSDISGGPFDPSIATAVGWAQRIHNDMTLGVSAWHYWTWHSRNPNQQLIDISTGAVSKTLYIMGQWSRFVRPGWLRIDATANPANEVYVTAFKETTSGDFAIVVVNRNSAPLNVEFSLAGFPSVTSVTPTLTSASSDLEDQANVNISDDAFSYSLPAASVVTFHGSIASSNTSKVPAAPTSLAATVN